VLSKDRKTELIGSYKTHDADTGSPEVQVAILSERINYLTASGAACSITSRARTRTATRISSSA
jgi:ribosomal protein S15